MLDHVIAVDVPTLEICRELFLYVTTIPVLGAAAAILVVYRSVQVRPGVNGYYNEVESFLARHKHTVLAEGFCEDRTMCTGLVCITTYLIERTVP